MHLFRLGSNTTNHLPSFFKECMVTVLEELAKDKSMDLRLLQVPHTVSTDHTDISHLCVFVRYLDGKDFKEETLALIPLVTLSLEHWRSYVKSMACH